jgi:hypothetical protein
VGGGGSSGEGASRNATYDSGAADSAASAACVLATSAADGVSITVVAECVAALPLNFLLNHPNAMTDSDHRIEYWITTSHMGLTTSAM